MCLILRERGSESEKAIEREIVRERAMEREIVSKMWEQAKTVLTAAVCESSRH